MIHLTLMAVFTAGEQVHYQYAKCITRDTRRQQFCRQFLLEYPRQHGITRKRTGKATRTR